MTLLERCKSIAKKKLSESHGARYDRSEQQQGHLAHRNNPHKTKKRHIHLDEKKKEKPGSEVNTDPELENTTVLDR